MNDKKKYSDIKVTYAGVDYTVTIVSIKGVVEDRYGWKKDHIAVWLHFEPNMGSTIETGIELPFANYSGESLMLAIYGAVNKLIPESLKEQEHNRKHQESQDRHKKVVEDHADALAKLIEVSDDGKE